MTDALPPMQSLRALEAFARLGSVWRAAEELGVTRSAVSHRIALLEDVVGFAVLERAGKGAALTARGRRYAAGVSRSLALLADAGRRDDRAPLEGRLRVSSTAGFASMWLCQHIARFHAQHPGLQVEIATRARLDEIAEREADVTIAFGDGNWPNYVIQRLYDVEYLPVCSPSLLNREGGIARPEDLLGFALLHLQRRDDWNRWLAMAGVEVPGGLPGIVFSDLMLVQSAAIAGQGVMMGDTVTCTAALAAGVLVRPFAMTVPAPGSYYLVYSRRQRGNRAVQAFAAWISALIAERRVSLES